MALRTVLPSGTVHLRKYSPRNSVFFWMVQTNSKGVLHGL